MRERHGGSMVREKDGGRVTWRWRCDGIFFHHERQKEGETERLLSILFAGHHATCPLKIIQKLKQLYLFLNEK